MYRGTLTGVRYLDKILDPYAGAIGNDFILMNDNAQPHRTAIVIAPKFLHRKLSCGSRFGMNEIASSISRPESDRTSLGLSWQTSCCFKFFKVITRAGTKLTPCLVFTSHFGVRELNLQHEQSISRMHSR